MNKFIPAFIFIVNFLVHSKKESLNEYKFAFYIGFSYREKNN
jgi:hypothetical protein